MGPDRILPERQSRYQDTGYHDHHHPMSRGRSYAVTRRQDYYDPYEGSQPSYNDHHVITRHQMGADRQLATLGGDPNWTQTFVNGSAVALLAFLFLLNLTQDVISQITGGGRRRRRRRDLSRNSENQDSIFPMIQRISSEIEYFANNE